MSDSKHCCTCKQVKPTTEFYRNRTRYDGLQAACKSCRRSYKQSPTGKATNRRAMSKYRSTPENKLKDHARNAVNLAIQSGKIARPDCCSACSNVCKPEGHHESYERADWLSVIWLCRACHVALHKGQISTPG